MTINYGFIFIHFIDFEIFYLNLSLKKKNKTEFYSDFGKLKKDRPSDNRCFLKLNLRKKLLHVFTIHYVFFLYGFFSSQHIFCARREDMRELSLFLFCYASSFIHFLCLFVNHIFLWENSLCFILSQHIFWENIWCTRVLWWDRRWYDFVISSENSEKFSFQFFFLVITSGFFILLTHFLGFLFWYKKGTRNKISLCVQIRLSKAHQN
jgi:hypothetical protein